MPPTEARAVRGMRAKVTTAKPLFNQKDECPDECPLFRVSPFSGSQARLRRLTTSRPVRAERTRSCLAARGTTLSSTVRTAGPCSLAGSRDGLDSVQIRFNGPCTFQFAPAVQKEGVVW